MSDQTSGGVANCAGAAFELRLGVQFCAYMLAGDKAGLGPGAVSLVQPQAPGAIDDLVVKFESGARWAIQAKAGHTSVSWRPDSAFGKALRQLHHGATTGQIDLSLNSMDRLELAVDHQAPRTVTAFGDWLDKARRHLTWEGFAEACTSATEQTYVEELPALLKAPPDHQLLAFVKKLYVRRRPPADEWRERLRQLLITAGVAPGASTADQVLDVLLLQVQDAAPHRGQLEAHDLLRACEAHKIEGIPHPTARLVSSFRVLEQPDQETLRALLISNPIRLERFVERPELTEALASERGSWSRGRRGLASPLR